MLSHPSCCNFPLLGNLFQQVVIELDYSVSKIKYLPCIDSLISLILFSF